MLGSRFHLIFFMVVFAALKQEEPLHHTTVVHFTVTVNMKIRLATVHVSSV